MKYLIWVLLIYVGWRWYSASKARAEAGTSEADGAQASGKTQPQAETYAADAAENMVRCAQCGLHLPLSEALSGSSTEYFCSEAHRIQYH